jgi:hypothetical protein
MLSGDNMPLIAARPTRKGSHRKHQHRQTSQVSTRMPKSPRGKVHLLQLHNQAIYLTFATIADKASNLIGSHMRNSHKGTNLFFKLGIQNELRSSVKLSFISSYSIQKESY